MRRLLTAILLALMVAGCGGGGSGSGEKLSEDKPPSAEETTSGDAAEVYRADFGDDWPLTVESGTLACEGFAAIIEVDGTKYALNGTAKGDPAYEDIEPIWAPNPQYEGAKKNIGVLIDEALKLCE